MTLLTLPAIGKLRYFDKIEGPFEPAPYLQLRPAARVKKFSTGGAGMGKTLSFFVFVLVAIVPGGKGKLHRTDGPVQVADEADFEPMFLKCTAGFPLQN
jgi:hypothetical protein